MATNLRLRPDTARALRERAASEGRSQQDIMREAIDAYLLVRETEHQEDLRLLRSFAALGAVHVPPNWRRRSPRAQPGPPSEPVVDSGFRISLPAGRASERLIAELREEGIG
jgi:predicted transcriptional regulator